MGIVYPFVCAVSFFTSCFGWKLVCDTGWYKAGEYCYQYHREDRSWADAQSYCRRRNGYLVSIRDQGVQKCTERIINGCEHVWTAGYRSSGSWLWDGQHKTFIQWSNWDKGEPNNLGGNENCIELDKGREYRWNDNKCDSKMAFVCEKHACHLPPHCTQTTCTNTYDYRCRRCADQGANVFHSLYWLSQDQQNCDATCSWKENWCWPGTCTANLAKNCHCSDGFSLASSDPARCQITKKPHILKCLLGAESSKGEVGNSTTSGECKNEKSTYINFQPASLSFKFTMVFEMPHNLPSKPGYITEYQFGVVYSEVQLNMEHLQGEKSALHIKKLIDKRTCTHGMGDLDPKADHPIDCNNLLYKHKSWNMQDGERLCLIYTTSSGGFMKYKDFSNTEYSPIIYNRVNESKEVCINFDSSPPKHCSEEATCEIKKEPLILISGRLTRVANVNIQISGWVDPFPLRSNQASGIKSYTVTIHDTKEIGKNTLIMDEKPIQSHKLLLNDSVSISLPREPALYGIALEVLDNAGNVKSARRFVMFDNSSKIHINSQNHLKVDSASLQTNFTWQTHRGNSCISWKDRYYNSYNLRYNLLRKIQRDYHGLFNGVYEQESGTLSVSGTPNVFGIVSFYYSWYKGKKEMWRQVQVPGFPVQRFCVDFDVKDGDTHTIEIKSEDIMKNTLAENITFHVDASVPYIEDLWLEKDGVKQLFVHNSKDLSKMTLEFKAYDPHSGLYSLEYFLGTSIGGNELAYKAVGVQVLGNKTCSSLGNCYCPSVGLCESSLYRIEFNHLIKNNTNIGQHNRAYYFTVKATNGARLVSIQHLDILSDDSPPVKGVVVEGPIGHPDIDYTSEDSVNVRWSGFIDHESEIMKYRIGVSDQCLTTVQMNTNIHSISKNNTLYETTYDFLEMALPYDGRYYFSVLAFNNALEPSDVVCSDGITRDSSPVVVKDFILESSKARPTIGCFNGKPWHVLENLTAYELESTKECQEICNGSASMQIIQYLPKIYRYENHSEYSTAMCIKIRKYSSEDWFIYIPSDKMKFSWKLVEQESQIQEVNIGFGTTESTYRSPDLMSYIKTYKFNEYQNIHLGLDLGSPVYAFVKVTNKADLETVVKFGPFIIDETAPIYKGKVSIFQTSEEIYVGWNNDTFIEAEQKESMDSILFRIGTDGKLLTPFLEAKITETCPGKYTTCFKYPIYRVRKLNSKKDSEYYFHLYVFNRAGHSLEVPTDSFLLPPQYPPTNGTIIEVESNRYFGGEDVDFSFQNDTICFKWRGFWHIQMVSLAIGIVSSKTNNSAIGFQNISLDTKCVHNLNLSPFTKYYTIVRATVGSQSTTSISDGFTVIDNETISKALEVYTGISCRTQKFIELLSINSTNLHSTFSVRYPLKMFTVYTVLVGGNKFDSKDIFWISKSKNQFIPLISYPIFYTTDKGSHTSSNFYISPCQEGKYYQYSKSKFDIFWRIEPSFGSLITHYQGGLFLVHQDGTKTIVDPMKVLGNVSQYHISGLQLQRGHAYSALIRPCFQKTCLPGKFSEMVVIEESKDVGNSIQASISMNNQEERETKLNIGFKIFHCGKSGKALGYAAALFVNLHREHLTPWLPISFDLNLPFVNHTFSLNLPVYEHRKMDVCVKAVCITGHAIISCQNVKMESNPDEYSSQILYEIDSESDAFPTIVNLASSRYLGEKLQLLHDNEVDVTLPSKKVYGFLNGQYGRLITWYLMKQPMLPHQDCETDFDCLQSTTSYDGLGRFTKMPLKSNVIYYICAHSNPTSILLEDSGVELEELRICGNGFIIDDTPPFKGKVEILNAHDNYLTDDEELVLHWSGFSDLERHIQNIESGIARYEYCIGSVEGGQDILLYTNAGLQTSIKISDLNFTNGMTYFATVKAIDLVGHTTVVSSVGKIVDISPPEVGVISIGNGGSENSFLSGGVISFEWEGFTDEESGIQQFLLGVGSTNDSADVVDFIPIEGSFTRINQSELMIDGYQYYGILKVVNNAGLYIVIASEPFMFDKSPPQKGVVRDGVSLMDDDDFQNDTRIYHCHWTAFIDPHSGINFYEVGIGTKPFTFDVFPASDVGLLKEFSWHSVFEPGVKYFSTVKACNYGGLCTSVSSDGIIMDDSPPVPGLVYVGFSNQHEPYLPHRSSISAFWAGFVDPHSDLDHFEWCIGINPGKCQIINFQNIMLSNRITRTGLRLPNSTNLYLTVRAFNRVGLFTERSSPKFQIDSSPPTVIIRPEFITDGLSLIKGTQYDNSVIKVRWQFEDLESSIIRHHVIIEVNKNGHVILEENDIGSERQLMVTSINETILTSGDSYIAKVSACNGAGLCTTEISDHLLIDSTPPTLGGFKNPMSWHNIENITRVHLAWYGFLDIESGLNEYHISVSRSYSGDELSNGPIIVKHSTNDQQSLALNLSSQLSDNDVIFLTITAVNNIGLRSTTGKVSVILIASDVTHTRGYLKLQRHSCVSHYCNNDCTCAVIGQKCVNKVNVPCREVTDSSEERLNVSVYFGSLEKTALLTSSSSCISGYWEKRGNSSGSVLRYEWSLGETGASPGSAIFDRTKENIWNDIGLNTYIVYCLPKEKALNHDQHYTLYVKAWMSESDFVIFSSTPLLVDLTPPKIKRGRSVIESEDNCKSDIDFIEISRPFLVCWNGVFTEGQSNIMAYDFSAGTRPFADDFIPRTTVNTSSVEVNQTMVPGTTVFFTIVAKNSLGLETIAVSDGILVDTDRPVPGTVYNTKHFRNLLYQSSNVTLSTSWYGFEDHQSSIDSYEVGIYEENTGAKIRKVESVAISSHFTFSDLNLKHNASYYTKVRAYDAMRHSSPYVNSHPVRIDNTPPFGIKCQKFEEIEFKFSTNITHKNMHGLNKVSVQGIFSSIKNSIYKVVVDIPGELQFNKLKLHVGNETMLLHMSQNALSSSSTEHQYLSIFEGKVELKFKVFSRHHIFHENIQVRIYRCALSALTTSPLMVRQVSPGLLSICSFIFDSESGVQDFLVGAGTTRGGFQVRSLIPFSKLNHGIIEVDAPHGSRIHLTAIVRNYAGLSSMFEQVIMLDHTPPIMSNLSVNIRNTEAKEDLEVLRGRNGKMTENETLPTNASEPVVNTTITKTEIKVTWSVSEDESGILSCYCSAGSTNKLASREWQRSLDNSECKFSNLMFDHGAKVSVSVRCINKVQLLEERTAGPFTIYHEPPNIERSSLSFYPNNRYTVLIDEPDVAVQSNMTHIDFSWNGFQDEAGISIYETRIRKNEVVIAPWNSVGLRNSASQKIARVLAADTIHVDVRAMNNGGFHSQIVNASIVLDNRPPRLTGKSASLNSKGENYSLRWINVFLPSQYGSTVYQVSVGSSDGSSDVQSPVYTRAEELIFDWIPDKSQHQLFVNILSFAPNGEFARFNKTFFV